MPLEEVRAELARVSSIIETRYGSNRKTTRRLTPKDKGQAAQFGRLRATLLARIEEGTLTDARRDKAAEAADRNCY